MDTPKSKLYSAFIFILLVPLRSEDVFYVIFVPNLTLAAQGTDGKGARINI